MDKYIRNYETNVEYMKTLVTGGAGFIGSNLVNHLIKQGNQVVVIDNESADCHDSFYWNPQAQNHKLDINDKEKITPLFADVEVVFHLAAEARIQPSFLKPQLTAMTNVVGTLNVLQAAYENNVKRIVYSSTSSSYGKKNRPPFKESMPTDCMTPYTVTKVAGEELCKVFAKFYNLETIILRYFNVYGENQPIRGPYAPVVGLFMRQFNSGLPMTIVDDGYQRRDMTYVQDVVEANMLAATTNNEEAFGEIINIGTGFSYNMFDLVNFIGGKNASYIHVPPRPGEVRMTLADIGKAEKLLGWTPKKQLKEWINEQSKSKCSP